MALPLSAQQLAQAQQNHTNALVLSYLLFEPDQVKPANQMPYFSSTWYMLGPTGLGDPGCRYADLRAGDWRLLYHRGRSYALLQIDFCQLKCDLVGRAELVGHQLD